MIRQGFLLAVVATAAWGQDWLPAPQFAFSIQQPFGSDADYQRGLGQLDGGKWEQAIDSFAVSAKRGGVNADAALYWKAYAENRAGKAQAALATATELRQRYPASRWIKDARALELEVRAQTGSPVNPSAVKDDELKLVALNSLAWQSPTNAVPVIQKVLSSNNSDRVKEQALFVLSQDSSREASKLLDSVASSGADPHLQVRAINLLGMRGNEDARKSLSALYNGSSDLRVKRAILSSYPQSGSQDLLFKAAKTEANPELRHDAIRQLAVAGQNDQLWALYQLNGSVGDRKAILQSMIFAGDAKRLTEIASTDEDPQIRIAAIQSLGLMDGRTSDALVGIYGRENDPKVRGAVLDALVLQQNGKALVELAQNERDAAARRRIVERMQLIQSKEAKAYLMGILK